jgi:WD40 repeat protein
MSRIPLFGTVGGGRCESPGRLGSSEFGRRIANRRPSLIALGLALGFWAITTALGLSTGASRCLAQGVPPDFLSPTLVLNATGHTDEVRAMVFSGDGRYLISGGRDKVVHVWEVNDRRLRLDRSIRPPIRRRGGRVLALALSPVADAQGRRLLAVAGVGAIGSRGGILLYRVPGRTDREAGDLQFDLSPSSSETPIQERLGHSAEVLGLAFSPDGRHLASSSEDKTIRVWDMQAAPPKTVAVLQGHTGAASGLAFLDDARIVSGGAMKDGSVRLWDWRAQRLVTWVAPSDQDLAFDEGKGVGINALVADRDGRHVVVGRENGKLERYDGADLGNGVLLNPESANELRPVEALAISPDGRSLASSVLKYRASKASYPRTECEVVVRTLPEGRTVGAARTVGGLVKALAFAPDGRSLAVAGGEAQQIALVDAQGGANDQAPPANGPGTVLWEAAFVDAKPTVAFSRTRPVGAEAIAWEGFDLAERRFVPVAPGAALSGAVQSIPGWRFTSRGFDRISLEPTQGAEIPVQLTPIDGRWSSFTFIPANAQAGHPKPCIAIGCEEGGVLIYSLPDGVRTRLLLGHSGAVQSMAPSADGRWLVTSSADMTLALWSLAGCDVRPALGATIVPDDQGQGGVVKEVLSRGMAERMGLKVGDRVERIERVVSVARREPLTIGRLDAELAAIAPSLEDQARFQVRRQGVATAIPMSTSRSEVPSLSLFPGGDREWIVWMPEGYYETSIAGDRRLLGWHLNQLDTSDPNRWLSLSSEFFPMSRYEKQLRRPDVIDAVLKTGDAVAALALAKGAPVVQKPPAIRVIAPRPAEPGAEIVATEPELNLRVEAEASPERRVRSLVVHSDTIRYPAHAIEPAAPLASATERIRLRPDKNIVTIEATDDQGVTAIEKLELRLDARRIPPPVVPAQPRLVIRSFGIEKFKERGIPDIRHAKRDAEELAQFFKRPDDRLHFDENRIDLKVVSDAEADAKRILGAFDELAGEARTKKLKAGDTVFIILESHLLKADSAGSIVLSSDSTLQSEAQHAVPGAAVSERLEEVTNQGCLVMLLVDGLHGAIPGAGRSSIQEWIRDLSGKRGVLVLTASKQDSSERLSEMGAFAQAVIQSSSIAGGSADRSGAESSTTLFDFQQTVLRLVSESTSRRQFAGFYPPETLAGWQKIRIFDPQAAPVGELVKR